jgi:hypothetical protein
MKKKASRPKAPEPPPARREARGPSPEEKAAVAHEYKVAELSTVDETSLETALNDWTRRGWTFDGIHFAMRDSSKRPAMAFVLFTRPAKEGPLTQTTDAPATPSALHPVPDLRYGSPDSWRRLRQLAGVEEDDDGSDEPSSD